MEGIHGFSVWLHQWSFLAPKRCGPLSPSSQSSFAIPCICRKLNRSALRLVSPSKDHNETEIAAGRRLTLRGHFPTYDRFESCGRVRLAHFLPSQRIFRALLGLKREPACLQSRRLILFFLRKIGKQNSEGREIGFMVRPKLPVMFFAIPRCIRSRRIVKIRQHQGKRVNGICCQNACSSQSVNRSGAAWADYNCRLMHGRQDYR